MLWGLKPVEQQAAYGLAVKHLKRQVHMGMLLPGERLPAERKLAEQIGISRVTLREALRVLEAEGYLSVKRGAAGGAFVAGEDALRQMALKRLGSDPAGVLRIFEYRAAVEPLAAQLSAIRRTPGDLRRLDQALFEISRASTVGELRRGEAAFHLAIAQASANPYINASIEDALASLFMPLPKGTLAERVAQSSLLRGNVVTAIRDRASPQAEQRMQLVIEYERARLSDSKAA
ncbi:MAG: GntR family transcriptional regulator [Pseudomonadota bacterium]